MPDLGPLHLPERHTVACGLAPKNIGLSIAVEIARGRYCVIGKTGVVDTGVRPDAIHQPKRQTARGGLPKNVGKAVTIEVSYGTASHLACSEY